MAPHPYPSLLPASQSLPTLTLRAPSLAAGGARSVALHDPGSRPFPRPSSPEPPSGSGRCPVARCGSSSCQGAKG